MRPHYGQLVIGPPGSGKTTYCYEMAQLLKHVFGRKLVIINLDPANENIPYTPDIDVKDAVSVEDVMELENLGPNGGMFGAGLVEHNEQLLDALMFAIEQLERDISWLEEKISALDEDCYVIFDCPGQIELYTHHKSFEKICKILVKKFDFRLVSVHLVDSYYCSDPAIYISVVLSSLSTMLCLGLPHLNVLSKVDLIEKMGKLDFDLAFYTEVQDLDFLLDRLEEQPHGKKLAKLSKAICEVIQDFSLVGFIPMSVKDRESIYHVVKNVDRITGYSPSDLEERRVRQTLTTLPPTGQEFDYSLLCNMQEKYIHTDEAEENSN